MGTRVEDTAMCGVFIKMYELTEEGCKPIEGEAKINNKLYTIYDSTGYLDEDGEKKYWKYFGVLLPEDVYSITAYAGKGFYPIKTERYNLLRRTSYTFYFYFVSKDAVKRN
jgi:hypothetical protein